jgi:hypothetical protein
VAKHLLYCSDIRTMCEKMRSKTMPQNMGRNYRRIKSGSCGPLLQYLEYAHAGELLSETRQEKMPFRVIAPPERPPSG